MVLRASAQSPNGVAPLQTDVTEKQLAACRCLRIGELVKPPRQSHGAGVIVLQRATAICRYVRDGSKTTRT